MQNVKPARPLINQPGRNQQTFLLVVIGAAIVLVAVFVFISANSTRSSFDEAFFAGIPQERTEDGGYVLGDPNAPITIVEFQDWYCSHCQEYKPTADRFIREYVATGKARYEFRVLMTAGASQQPNTEQLSNIVECIAIQKPNSYFYASELAYELVLSGLRGAGLSQALAERTGVDYAAMLRCTQDDATKFSLDERLATNSGASSTPAVFYRLNDSQPIPVQDRTFAGLQGLVETIGQ